MPLRFPQRVALATALACCPRISAAQPAPTPAQLSAELTRMDSLLFDAAFVRCNYATILTILSPDIEFYHDQTGYHRGAQVRADFRRLTTNCPREQGVQREVDAGSLQVFPIKAYGALQTGTHRFVQRDGQVTGARFSHVWHRTPGGWRLTRVLSVDHHPAPRESSAGATASPPVLRSRAGRRAAFDSLAPQWLATHRVPSLAVAVIEDGALSWTRVIGEAAPGVPATEATLYNVASVTKPIFAEVVHRLVSEGRLSLDAAMVSVWRDPDLDPTADVSRLTIRNALSHRIGFANWRRESGGKLTMLTPADSVAHYSGEGYNYVARYVERALNTSIDELARRMLFDSAGAREITFTTQPWVGARVARARGGNGAWSDHAPVTVTTGADDLVATIGDLGRVAASMLRGERLSAAERVARDSLQSTDPGTSADCSKREGGTCPRRFGYGLGWAVMDNPGDRTLWHTGVDDGDRAIILLFPDRRSGLVMVANGANGFQPMVEAMRLLAPEAAGVQTLLTLAR